MSTMSPLPKGQKILVVDDDVDHLSLLVRVLKINGYEVKERSDGLGAIELAQMWVPDLILSDIQMPNLDG